MDSQGSGAAGISIWLRVSLAEAMRRCAGGPPRPLWGAKADLESLYRYRTEFYRCARIAVDTDGVTPHDAVLFYKDLA